MRKAGFRAAWVILAGLMMGASAPKATTQPTALMGWVKMGLTEPELMAAAKAASVELQDRVDKGSVLALMFSDGRIVSIRNGKVAGVAKSTLKVPDEFQKDVKVGMTEKESGEALAVSGVKILERTEARDLIVYRLDDDRRVTFMRGKVFNIWKPSPATQPSK